MSTRKLEDGTISDQMESGYVATRPRFTRQRRTFGATYQNICAEDVRALDQFEVMTVMGKAGAFYYPNLLPNASFEFYSGSGSSVAFPGWNINVVAGGDLQMSVGVGAGAEDGTASVVFESISGAAAPVGNGNAFGNEASLYQAASIPVTPGDTLLFTGFVSVSLGTAPNTLGLSTAPFFTFSGPAGAQQSYPGGVTAATTGFEDYTASVTVPSGATALNVGILTFFVNDGTAPYIFDGTQNIFWDNLGLAVTATQQPYGRMPGSSSLANLVRFTKQPSIKDNSYAGGQATYDCTFEVTEV